MELIKIFSTLLLRFFVASHSLLSVFFKIMVSYDPVVLWRKSLSYCLEALNVMLFLRPIGG